MDLGQYVADKKHLKLKYEQAIEQLVSFACMSDFGLRCGSC